MMKIINGPEVTAKLAAGLRDIARLTGFSEKQVTRGEAGAILKTWAGRTKIAKAETVTYNVRKRALHDLGFTKTSEIGGITINTGARGHAGRVWVRTQGKRGKPWKLAGQMDFKSYGFVPDNFHWKRGDWIDINEAVQDSAILMRHNMSAAQNSAGLARQSVVQIADAAGIDLTAIPGGGISPAQVGRVRQAIASNGTAYQNGTAQEVQEPSRYFLTMIESLPYWPKIGMDRTLAGVLAGRVGLYRRTFQNGAYKSIESAAHNYPWMRTSLAA